MSFMDKAKSTADDFVNAVSGAVKGVSDKGKEVTGKAKINKSIKDEETKINNLYMVIGKKFFDANAAAPAGYENQFSGIKNAQAEIERLKKELEKVAAMNVCSKCGKQISAGQKFCQSCGNDLTVQ